MELLKTSETSLQEITSFILEIVLFYELSDSSAMGLHRPLASRTVLSLRGDFIISLHILEIEGLVLFVGFVVF